MNIVTYTFQKIKNNCCSHLTKVAKDCILTIDNIIFKIFVMYTLQNGLEEGRNEE